MTLRVGVPVLVKERFKLDPQSDEDRVCYEATIERATRCYWLVLGDRFRKDTLDAAAPSKRNPYVRYITRKEPRP